MSTTEPSVQESPQESASGERSQPHACVLCAQRKIKCDRIEPCSNCKKSRSECIYRAPAPPQRRKRKIEVVDSVVIERLKQYEEKMKTAGIPFEQFDTSSLQETSSEAVPKSESNSQEPLSVLPNYFGHAQDPHSEKGKLVLEPHSQRYFEAGLLSRLSKLLDKNPTELIEEDQSSPDEDALETMDIARRLPSLSSASDLILGQSPSTISEGFAMDTAMIRQLWQIFLDNVHPLTMLLHPPSLRSTVDKILRRDHVEKSHEALINAVCACAIMSMPQEEVQQLFGKPRSILLARYQSAARCTLASLRFIKASDMPVLQAYMLLLTSMQEPNDALSLWVLTGTAIRMGQGLGLHRDGLAFGLEPLQVEMRRRLWWYIVAFDYRITEMAGCGSSLLPETWDTQLPLNVNDDDLSAGMETPPTTYQETTDMTFVLTRYEIARYMQHHKTKHPTEPQVEELQGIVEAKYLRFCDPVKALHILTNVSARALLNKLRHIAYKRREFGTVLNGKKKCATHDDIPDQVKERLFAYGIRNMEYDILLHSTRATQRYRWHVRTQFAWGAQFLVLRGLSLSSNYKLRINEAWQKVEELYSLHPEWLDTRKFWHNVICEMALRAWTTREQTLKAEGFGTVTTPPFIETLKQRRRKQKPVVAAHDGATAPVHKGPIFPEKLFAFPQDQSFDTSWDPNFIYSFDTGDMGMQDFASIGSGFQWPTLFPFE